MDRFASIFDGLIGEYSSALSRHGGGRSLARVGTIVVNRGSFFSSLAQGRTCSIRNADLVLDYLQDPENWPGGLLSPYAASVLEELQRLALPGLAEGAEEESRLERWSA